MGLSTSRASSVPSSIRLIANLRDRTPTPTPPPPPPPPPVPRRIRSRAEQMIGCGFYAKKRPPSDGCWLSTLLRCNFFGSCVAHHYLRKNEKNIFCIDCNVGFCKHCMTAHGLHRRLQICKYVYQDVVRLQEVQKHLDCSKIQTYKINGEKAVHLNPRPQSKDTKPSTKSKNGGTCEACGRYIQDLPNRFCSIACKVSVVSLKPNNERNPDIITIPIEELTDLSLKDNYFSSSNGDEKDSSTSMAESSEDAPFGVSSGLKPRSRSNKRKGFPRRAPLQ